MVEGGAPNQAGMIILETVALALERSRTLLLLRGSSRSSGFAIAMACNDFGAKPSIDARSKAVKVARGITFN